jgi:glycosyltransferase involved in cell wall biosynthesis
MALEKRAAPLLVFSDDWGRHPSSCQHLIRELLPTRDVLWVNTIGTRPPRFDLRTAQRVIEKLKHWSGAASQPRAPADEPSHIGLAPEILSPRMWPSFASSPARKLNQTMLTRALTPAIERMAQAPVAITTLPIVADLVGQLPVAKWIYYCVDDFSVWPGYDGKTMGAMERELVPKMHNTVAASEALAQGLKELGANPTLITHGVDLSRWNRQSDQTHSELPEFAGLDGPYIVFWGVIDRRMDTDWVAGLSEALRSQNRPGTIVLFGPQEDPEPRLRELPRVSLRGAVRFERLADIAAHSSVLIMPYQDMPATRAMQPLKLKEYLANGLPVVVRNLPSTQPWSDACDVCDAHETFIRFVLMRLDSGASEEQKQARLRLNSESWKAKAALLEQVIDAPSVGGFNRSMTAQTP